MSNDIDDSLDFLDDAEPTKPAKQSRRKSRRPQRFNTGLERVTHKEAARATASKSMAGQYKRYTVYLAPDDIAHFKEIAAEVNLSQAEAGRWFFQHMFNLFDEGLRPETEAVVIRRRLKRR